MNKERLRKLQEWEAQKPDDAFLKFAIAQEYVSAGKDNEALKYFLKLVAKFPDYLPIYYQYGKLFEKLGDVKGAMESYQKGMKVAKAANDLKTFGELKEALILLEDE